MSGSSWGLDRNPDHVCHIDLDPAAKDSDSTVRAFIDI